MSCQQSEASLWVLRQANAHPADTSKPRHQLSHCHITQLCSPGLPWVVESPQRAAQVDVTSAWRWLKEELQSLFPLDP